MSQASSIDGLNSGDVVASAASADRSTNLALGISNNTWIKIGVVAALMVALFWYNLHRLWDKTNPFTGEANWTHAIGIPFICLYYLYVNREELLTPQTPRLRASVRTLLVIGLVELMLAMNLLWVMVFAHELLTKITLATVAIGAAAGAILWIGRGRDSAPSSNPGPSKTGEGKSSVIDYANVQDRESSRLEKVVEKFAMLSAEWFGGFIMIFGIALYAYGIYPGQNDFVKDFGMVVTIFGVATMLAGWARMKIAWFAVAMLVCGIPWPGLVYSRIAGPLQWLAARVAVWTLEVTGVESSANGTKIQIAGQGGVVRTLNVAEACAGLHSLMTFITVGAAVAFLSNRALWQKIVITASAVPIAIACNVVRISGQGLIDHYWSQQLSEGFAHQFVGLIMLIPAFILILLVCWALDKIYLEEVDRTKKKAPTLIRQRTAQVAMAPVAAGSGRSLASTKAAAAAVARPAATAVRPAVKIVTPPPPSVRLASKPPAAKPQAPKPQGPKAPPRA